MSKPIILSGTVSHINYFSSTSGSIKRGEGTIKTKHNVSFRIDNAPVTFPGTPNLGEGDIATMAFFKSGIASGAAILRNDTTGVKYICQGRISCLRFIGGLCIFLGLLYLSKFLVALILGGIGFWIISQGNKAMQELKQSIST